MIDKKNILITLPAYNEATVIKEVLIGIQQEGYPNILVVDDGSDDNTSKLAKEHARHVIKLCINCGVGAATRAAILAARELKYDYLVFIDADGQHYAEDIKNLIQEMEQSNSDLVIGSRFLLEQKGIPVIRRFYNMVANTITNFGRFAVTDSQSGFRMLNKKAIHNIHLDIDDYGVCTEMIWKSNKAKLKITETSIRVRYTDYSMSKGQNLWKGIKTGISLIKSK